MNEVIVHKQQCPAPTSSGLIVSGRRYQIIGAKLRFERLKAMRTSAMANFKLCSTSKGQVKGFMKDAASLTMPSYAYRYICIIVTYTKRRFAVTTYLGSCQIEFVIEIELGHHIKISR